MGGDVNKDTDSGNWADDLFKAWNKNYSSNKKTKEKPKLKNKKVTKFPVLVGGFRYCYLSKTKKVIDIARLIEVDPNRIREANRSYLGLEFEHSIIPGGSTIVIPEPSDNFWEGFRFRNIGGRKGHRGGVDVDVGVTLMKKGYNPGITY